MVVFVTTLLAYKMDVKDKANETLLSTAVVLVYTSIYNIAMFIHVMFLSRSIVWIATDTQCPTIWKYTIFRPGFWCKGKLGFTVGSTTVYSMSNTTLCCVCTSRNHNRTVLNLRCACHVFDSCNIDVYVIFVACLYLCNILFKHFLWHCFIFTIAVFL